ncbi:hypothetical protein FB451DRAFT_1339067 [Mycena latifolia]|nr:hypothetical protein FB451DRAFT_1339067 [Mycena latifolia]
MALPPTPHSAHSQFIQADDDDDLDEESIPGFSHPTLPQSPAPPSKGKGRAREPEQLAPPSSANGRASPSLSGNIGSGAPRPTRSTVGGVQVERRFSSGDTLDEPVSTTIARDLLSIYSKLVQVLYPRRASGREVLRSAPEDQALNIFTSVIAICTIGALTVTVQAKLLGGRVSFFQALCVLGYCIAPLDIAALVACFVPPIALLGWAWCIWASVNFLDGTKIEQQRILLAVYPLLLFYFVLAWMILIQ